MHSYNTCLHNSVHSQSEKWQAMCWWPWTSSTTCLWRTWGSSEEPSCTRTGTPSQSSLTTDVMETSACVSWVWKTSQVSDWIVFWLLTFVYAVPCCGYLWVLWVPFEQTISKWPVSQCWWCTVSSLNLSPIFEKASFHLRSPCLLECVCACLPFHSPPAGNS